LIGTKSGILAGITLKTKFMKLRNALLVAVVCAFAMACNNQGTTSNATDSSSVANENTTAETKTKTSVEVPAATKTSFEAKYPNVTNVTWTHPATIDVPIDWDWVGWPVMADNDYLATFDMDNSNYWVWYDDNGTWIGTVTEINTSGLPDAVNNTIKSQFPGFTIVSAKKENDKNRTAYEVKLENGSDKMKALIAEDGTLMKKKGTMSGQEVKEKSVKEPTKQ
jgi:hypothetical protein